VGEFLKVEDLDVYQKLCRLQIEAGDLTKDWPPYERFERGSQIRRSSNGSPANLAVELNDRHLRNKFEGVDRARTEALQAVHHLDIARLKGYVTADPFEALRSRYVECVRMLNGLGRNFEKRLSPHERRFSTTTEP